MNGGTMSSSTELPVIKHVLRERSADGGWTPIAAICTLFGQTVFIPAEIPCGECGACRRAIVSSCVAVVRWLSAELVPVTPIGNRFAYAFDASLISERQALWAAIVLPWLEAMGRTGLGPGDVSFWLGESPLVLVGACLANARGSQAIVSGPPILGETMAAFLRDQEDSIPTFTALHNLDEKSLAAQSNAPSGFIERQIFTQGEDPMLWSAAGTLLGPGCTLVVFGALPALAGLPADARIFTIGSLANPDFAPEALAALSRDAMLSRICMGLVAAGAFDIVPSEGLA
jgi:hypothetical protein